MSPTRHSGENLEAVLQRARDEEAAERDRDRSRQGRIPRTTRVADLESPVLRVNKRVTRRKVSTFSVIVLLFAAASAIVLYIGHIIALNHLAVEADRLRTEYDELLQTRGKLQAEIDRKSARERIVRIATTRLNLRLPTGQARWITVEDAPGAEETTAKGNE